MPTPNPIRTAIEAGNQQFMAAFARRDAAGIAQLYTEDGQVLPPQSEPIAGRPGIQAFWQAAMDMGIKTARLESVEVTHHGDIVYEVGRYALEAEGGQLLDRGKFVVIYQRQGEVWKLHRDIWNTSRPG
jgi:uncharacterized protein (TIGR02246 family)